MKPRKMCLKEILLPQRKFDLQALSRPMICFDDDFDRILHDQSFNDQRKLHHQSLEGITVIEQVRLIRNEKTL